VKQELMAWAEKQGVEKLSELTGTVQAWT
jgi:hypothetical protein